MYLRWSIAQCPEAQGDHLGVCALLQGYSSAVGACRWLEGLCAVLNRIVDAHEKRGAPHTKVM
jgi:hypothetical protein